MHFKSIIELLNYFKDEETGIEYYENIRWDKNPTCPRCGSGKPYKTNRGWKCRNKECHKKFTVKVGTMFENSKIPFRVWFAAIYLATTSKKGVSSVQVASQLNITQKTAWFVLHRVREILKESYSTPKKKEEMKKQRSETYEKKLSIEGSLDDVLKVSVAKNEKDKKNYFFDLQSIDCSMQ